MFVCVFSVSYLFCFNHFTFTCCNNNNNKLQHHILYLLNMTDTTWLSSSSFFCRVSFFFSWIYLLYVWAWVYVCVLFLCKLQILPSKQLAVHISLTWKMFNIIGTFGKSDQVIFTIHHPYPADNDQVHIQYIMKMLNLYTF